MRKLVCVSAIIMLILGVTGLAFGIVLIVSANSIHNETVKELEKDGAPTTIAELRDKRDYLAETRRDLSPTLPDVTDPRYQPWLNLLILEKGVGLSLTSLSRAMMYQYAGIGVLVLGIGLAAGGVVQFRMAGRMT